MLHLSTTLLSSSNSTNRLLWFLTSQISLKDVLYLSWAAERQYWEHMGGNVQRWPRTGDRESSKMFWGAGI